MKKTRTETSAGGLIVRRADHGWELLFIKDPKGKWTFPKGHIEGKEKILETAIREIGEEVGIHDLVMRAELTPAIYMFTRNGLVRKTVHFYLFETHMHVTPVPQLDEGITDVAWIPLSDAAAHAGYPKTNKPLIAQAIEYFTHKT